MGAVIRNLSPSYWISIVTTYGRRVYLEPRTFLWPWILMPSILVPGLPTKGESSRASKSDGPGPLLATTACCWVWGMGNPANRNLCSQMGLT